MRTETNRRLYSEADIERLEILKEATADGHGISSLAQMETGALAALLVSGKVKESKALPTGSGPSTHYQACLAAVRDLDFQQLDLSLTRAAVELTRPSLIEEVVKPLLREVGELWAEGGLKVAHEHMASFAVRAFLGDLLRSSEAAPGAPKIVLTTPSGQLHELGALMAAVIAADEGWEVVFLGSNLPSEEIAAAVQLSGARAVGLSIVHPQDDPRLVRELKKLARYLPEDVVLMVGGRASEGYEEILEEIGARRIEDVSGFRRLLESLRSARGGDSFRSQLGESEAPL